MIPSSSYCYEIEQFDDSDAGVEGQIGTAPFDRVRRRKGVYSRDKSRLFLKQFVEARPGGVIGIKVIYYLELPLTMPMGILIIYLLLRDPKILRRSTCKKNIYVYLGCFFTKLKLLGLCL